MSARGTTNTNDRGSAESRRRRKQWLLDTFGDGITAPCYRYVLCGQMLTAATLTVDRITPGILGGTYRRDNIRPACMNCNSTTGTQLREQLKNGEIERV